MLAMKYRSQSLGYELLPVIDNLETKRMLYQSEAGRARARTEKKVLEHG